MPDNVFLGRRRSRQGDDQPEYPDNGSDQREYAVFFARLLLSADLERWEARLRCFGRHRASAQLGVPCKNMVRVRKCLPIFVNILRKMLPGSNQPAGCQSFFVLRKSQISDSWAIKFWTKTGHRKNVDRFLGHLPFPYEMIRHHYIHHCPLWWRFYDCFHEHGNPGCPTRLYSTGRRASCTRSQSRTGWSILWVLYRVVQLDFTLEIKVIFVVV